MSITNLKIREYKKTDLDAVENLAVEIQEYERSVDRLRTEGELIKKAHVADLLTSIENRKGVLLIADLDDQPIGYIVARLESDRMDIFERVYIADLGVTQKYRGWGVGTKLIQAVEDLAKEKFNTEYLTIGVLASNTEAHRLYQKLGFVDREVELIKKIR